MYWAKVIRSFLLDRMAPRMRETSSAERSTAAGPATATSIERPASAGRSGGDGSLLDGGR
jgi:hypothetical protein